MLKEFMADAEARANELHGEAAVQEIINTFDAGINLLRDPERFPDPATNIVATSAHRLIRSRAVLSGLFPDLDVSSLSFMVIGEEPAQLGCITFPHEFHNMAAQDPVLQLGAIAFNAEKTRLFLQGYNMRDEVSVGTEQRALAAEAGMAVTISELLKSESIGYSFTDRHEGITRSYPAGLASISEIIASGHIAADRADHLRPEEVPEPVEVEAIGELDCVALISRNLPQIRASVTGALRQERIVNLKMVEHYLRQVSSSLFLHAFPADHMGAVFQPRDIVTGERREFGIGLTRSGPDGRTSPNLVLEELGETYEENVEKLNRTGAFVMV